MRRIKSVAALSAVAVVAAVTISGVAPATAGAGIVETSGAVSASAAPRSVRPGAATSKSSIRAFAETGLVMLAAPLAVDAPAVGVRYTRRSQLPSLQIAAGTSVESHMLYADTGKGSKTLQGRIVLDAPIAGLLTSDAQLDMTDRVLGRTGTRYPTGTYGRGVELGDHPLTPATDEWIEVVDERTLEVRLEVATLDQLRVLTQVLPAGDAPVAEDDDAEVTEGEPLVQAAPGVLANDTSDGGGLNASLLEPPSNGTAELSADGSYRYTPEPGFVGTDRFTYRATDTSSRSDVGTVTVTVRPMSLSFSQSALVGGSIVNVVAMAPALDGTVLAGSDVGGVYRSTDWGATWNAANTGAQGTPSVAALQFSPTIPGKAYAASGDGANGTFAVSVDDGVSWDVRSTALHFDGGHGRPGRVTGNLIAFDDDRGLLYAATWDQGVMRSADDGRTWSPIGLAGADLRSLVIDADEPDVLYATTYPGVSYAGVYKTTAASGTSPKWTSLAASPRDVEEMVMIGDSLYAASGFDGVHASHDGGATWQQLGTGTTLGSGTAVSGGPIWVSIDGYETAEGATLYAGAIKPAASGAGHDTVMRSVDGGDTWTSLTNDPAAIHDEIGGPGGKPWWWDGKSWLGRANSWANHIEVAAGAPGRVFVSGRVDIWSTADDGANWYPMVDGLGVTINRDALVDPNQPSRVYVPTMDWVMAYSIDGMREDVHRTLPAGSSQGWAAALDTSTTPARVLLGTGDMATNSKGELYSNADPATSKWVSEGLGALTGGKRVIGVAANVVNGESIVLAAIEQGGIWRKAGGRWTQVSTAAMAGAEPPGPAARFAWLPDSPHSFLYDRNTGVWRSSDAGRTWTRIWEKPSKANNTGYIALDPTEPGTLYVSVGWDGVYRLAGATAGVVGSGITAVEVGDFTLPGPIEVDRHGRLYVASLVLFDPARLTMSTDRGATWHELADDVWRATAMRPWSIDVAPDGTLYVATRGMGVLIGEPRR